MMSASGCTFIYSPQYYCDIGAHVFPMEKFRLVYDALLRDGDVPASAFLAPGPATLDDLRLVHTKAYLDDLVALRSTARTLPSELPLSSQIVRAYFLAAGGTILACRRALADGRSMNLTGGFHHTFPDHAEGFCYINDIAVAVRKLRAEGRVARAAVVDCDLHQGNGTAAIFQTDPSVFTFSMHQENNYPIKQQSDIDIGLDDGTGDDEYVELLERHLVEILDSFQPELVLYVAGADPYERDQLGGLGLSLDGLRRRDGCVIGHCAARNIPLAVVLAGGYAQDLAETIQIHHTTARLLWEAAGGSNDVP